MGGSNQQVRWMKQSGLQRRPGTVYDACLKYVINEQVSYRTFRMSG